MSKELVLHLDKEEETERFGRFLGACLPPGTVIALVGELGAGKTCLTRAIGTGLGMSDPSLVTSPTFVLQQDYDARIPIHHFDAYRLASAQELIDLGALELFESDDVCIVEWADRVENCFAVDHVRIELAIVDGTSRRMTITARGERLTKVVEEVVARDQKKNEHDHASS